MSRRNRRQFLEDSMFAAAAAAMAAHDGRPLYAAQEPQSKSPNERLNVAIAGVNGRGGSHIGNLAGRNDVTVTHIVDVDSGVGNDKAGSVEKRQGLRPKVVEDVRQVLDDKNVDIV